MQRFESSTRFEESKRLFGFGAAPIEGDHRQVLTTYISSIAQKTVENSCAQKIEAVRGVEDVESLGVNLFGHQQDGKMGEGLDEVIRHRPRVVVP